MQLYLMTLAYLGLRSFCLVAVVGAQIVKRDVAKRSKFFKDDRYLNPTNNLPLKTNVRNISQKDGYGSEEEDESIRNRLPLLGFFTDPDHKPEQKARKELLTRAALVNLSNKMEQESSTTTDDVDRCGVGIDQAPNTVERCSFWMEGVFLSATGFFGLVGNIFSIVILSGPNMKNCFNQLRISLSTVDSIFIILAIVDYSISRAFRHSSDIFVYLFPFVTYPLCSISFCASIFLTVVLAYERYSAVCKPVHYRDVTNRYSVNRRTLSYVLPVFLLSILLNVPKFLESRVKWTAINQNVSDTHNTSNLHNDGFKYELTIDVTDLRSDPDYIRFYINWTRLVTTGLIPMSALVYFNFGIFRGIRMSRGRTRASNTHRVSELNLAAILLCIVILFIVCHCPRILLNVYEVFMLEDTIDCETNHGGFTPPVWFLCITSFNHWILIVNSSCNFLIYCSKDTNFKTAMKNLCRHSKFYSCLNNPVPEHEPSCSVPLDQGDPDRRIESIPLSVETDVNNHG